ncbi:ABC transporter [Salmonella enterica subsp. arizonae]|uniref:ABC transporter n=1 Tax=Salmonella enterica subsp. arizonae TaxID=59203 RepID=A0A379TKJ7_SALER|nr:ABC transporter [Salmonella enterica subsp. arizonae]
MILHVQNLAVASRRACYWGRAQLSTPNVLLLDEPSNHLDLPTLIWLEAFLADWRGSLILVSHDTRLLDTVTNSTWIIANGGVHQYRLPCTQALVQHEQSDLACQQQYQDQANEIERIEASGASVGRCGVKISIVKARQEKRSPCSNV